MAGEPKKEGTVTESGWVQSVEAARVVSAEELRRQAALFRPIPRQALFRDIAEEQVALGNFMLSRWLLATKEGAFVDRGWKPVTRGEYERWLVEPGFSDWFFAPIPQCGPLSEQEKQLADQVFLEGLMRGMQSAEDWAFKEYGRFRFAPQPAGVYHKAAAGSAEVKSFLAPETTTDAWAKSTKAEA